MIRNILLVAGILVQAAVGSAQDQISTIHFALGRVKIESGLDARNQEKVERQLAPLLTAGDNTYGTPYAVFVVSPVLSLLEQGKIEGIASRITARVNLQLRLANNISGEIFYTDNQAFNGAGATLDEAVGKALQGIRPNNPALRKTLDEGRSKILDYYVRECDNLQQAASEKETAKQFAAALSLLHSIPAGAPCFKEVQDKKNALFSKIQEQQCQNMLQKAEARTAANDFSGALNWLAQIDSQSPCAAAAKQRIADLETKVDDNQRTQNEWLFKFWEAGQDAEKARWNALSAFCGDWLRSHAKYELAPR